MAALAGLVGAVLSNSGGKPAERPEAKTLEAKATTAGTPSPVSTPRPIAQPEPQPPPPPSPPHRTSDLDDVMPNKGEYKQFRGGYEGTG